MTDEIEPQQTNLHMPSKAEIHLTQDARPESTVVELSTAVPQ